MGLAQVAIELQNLIAQYRTRNNTCSNTFIL